MAKTPKSILKYKMGCQDVFYYVIWFTNKQKLRTTGVHNCTYLLCIGISGNDFFPQFPVPHIKRKVEEFNFFGGEIFGTIVWTSELKFEEPRANSSPFHFPRLRVVFCSPFLFILFTTGGLYHVNPSKLFLLLVNTQYPNFAFNLCHSKKLI